jgi:hypothetical protein
MELVECGRGILRVGASVELGLVTTTSVAIIRDDDDG